MKKILLIIMALMGISLSYSFNTDHLGKTDDTEFPERLQYLLPDSVLQKIVGKQYLLYWYGHHGHVWSLIYRDDDNYRICIGTTRNEKPDPNATIDTIALIKDYRNLFQWGMDSLPIQAKDMTPHYAEGYNPFYSTLEVYNSNKIIFESKNANGFSGPDSITFNDKKNRLAYLMWWLSAPSIRQYLPGLEQYETK